MNDRGEPVSASHCTLFWAVVVSILAFATISEWICGHHTNLANANIPTCPGCLWWIVSITSFWGITNRLSYNKQFVLVTSKSRLMRKYNGFTFLRSSQFCVLTRSIIGLSSRCEASARNSSLKTLLKFSLYKGVGRSL